MKKSKSKINLKVGQIVVLAANPKEKWPEERARILEAGSFDLNECIIVELLEYDEREDDGLREVQISQIVA